MPNTVGKIPEFTDAPSADAGSEEVKEPAAEEVAEPETETPTELPAEENKPAEPEAKPQASDDTKEQASEAELIKQEYEIKLQGLRRELANKHKEVAELRGQKREIAQEEKLIIQQKIDDLKDLNPQDVAIIERIMRSKGMLTKEEYQRSTYDERKSEELAEFLDKYPEYKPENDPGDVNWSALQKELAWYKSPSDPRQIRTLLERAHQAVAKVPGDRDVQLRKRQMQTASVGGGGVQRSSVQKSSRFSSEQRQHFEKGGWSESEINEMEQNLQE